MNDVLLGEAGEQTVFINGTGTFEISAATNQRGVYIKSLSISCHSSGAPYVSIDDVPFIRVSVTSGYASSFLFERHIKVRAGKKITFDGAVSNSIICCRYVIL